MPQPSLPRPATRSCSKAPRRKQKRSPSGKSSAPKNNFFSRPEAREVQKAGGKKGGEASKRTGIPHGETRESITKARDKASVIAKGKVEQMAEELGIDLDEDKSAKAALEYAVGVIEADKDGTRDKLAAARLVLDFTKKKPANDSNLNLNTAEEFLAALHKKDQD